MMGINNGETSTPSEPVAPTPESPEPIAPTPEPDVPVPSTPNKKSNEEIANEVIIGKWGNGSERKKRLTNAGYDYASVQKIVNEKLK